MSGNSSPDWVYLVYTNQAKAIGISWNDEELRAIYELKIPPDFVRGGCLTLEQYRKEIGIVEETVKKTGKKPFHYMKKDELLAEARNLGIQASNQTTRAELILLIKKITESKLPADDEVQKES